MKVVTYLMALAFAVVSVNVGFANEHKDGKKPAKHVKKHTEEKKTTTTEETK